ncbi:sporulation protein [Bacillus sp. NTK074B]|uniref:CAP domain-containing protein n=1 Tax=Bacillus sp. NTK074B TaxID=2802174 RepID=UPI001A8C5E74|nr:sporulation protein [Bacillus sp. NTK074B]
MNKKMMVSTATALTLLATPFAAGKADAAAPCPTPDKVVQQANAFKYNGNQEDLNKFVQDVLSKYQMNGQNINVQELLKGQAPKAEAASPALAKEAPKTDAPKSEAPAPKAEAPASAPEAPKAEAPAPAPAANKQTQQSEQATEQSGQLSQFEQKVVELTNQERAKQGLPALKVDAELSKVAREKSRDMQANKYFSHTSPTYGSPFDMMKQFGIEYSSAGENIAMGQQTPEEVVQAWMNSEGHRKNIMSSNYTHIGVGYVENGNYWTQQFIGK